MGDMFGLTSLISGDGPLREFDWTARAVTWASIVGPRINEALKQATPVGKDGNAGRLRDATRFERRTSIGSVRLEWHAATPYTQFVLRGTSPHTIRATAALALHWTTPDGIDMFARMVRHPGTRPNDYPKRVLEREMPWITSSFVNTFRL